MASLTKGEDDGRDNENLLVRRHDWFGLLRSAVVLPPWSLTLMARYGPKPQPSRDGDKKQARYLVNKEVKSGHRPHPNALPCVDCGHVWTEGSSRHEYDHYLGYAAEHHLDVVAVCKMCHVRRDNLKARQTHCLHGHEFSPENTYRKSNGTRACRECMKRWEKERGPRGSEYWRKTNARRKAKNYGKAY